MLLVSIKGNKRAALSSQKMRDRWLQSWLNRQDKQSLLENKWIFEHVPADFIEQASRKSSFCMPPNPQNNFLDELNLGLEMFVCELVYQTIDFIFRFLHTY
jgi:hypothetical protein